VLSQFIAQPSAVNASRLVCIPAIYDVLQFHHQRNERYSQCLIEACKWVHDRGKGVLAVLNVHSAPPPVPNAIKIDDGWETVSAIYPTIDSQVLQTVQIVQTGCFYVKPQIRHRPEYPHLIHDTRKEKGSRRGAKCSKYFSKYGEQSLMGGIMCVWCTHSICYGFHCIPKGEGCNDVFSAIITRWVKAPRTVIYDFTCALSPYCMTREPDFFTNTLFTVDAFHAKGHMKCSPAAFLSTYANADPRLALINSSAAECGNGGLNRIRKSVSYMSQDHAIRFTKVFLSIWNRL
jgi:hypothetical protein